MKIMFLSDLIVIACLCLLMTASGSDHNCEEKEKSLLSLEIAEDLISKAKELFPNCTDIVTNTSDCGEKEKALVHLDMAKKLISEARENYPTCIETKDPTIKEPVTDVPETKEPIEHPKDCFEVLQNGQNVSGVYTIWPISSFFPNRSLEVFCDMETDGGGWVVVQRRGNFTTQEYFYRDWRDYKVGFGNIKEDFWLGNDNLFILSNQGKYKIRFDMGTVEGERAYALYETFCIENEKSNYKLEIGNFTGDAGDAMKFHNLMEFSTKDRDNDVRGAVSCSELMKGGWWYYNCVKCNPNGIYRPGLINDIESIYWDTWRKDVGLTEMEIKLKPF